MSQNLESKVQVLIKEKLAKPLMKETKSAIILAEAFARAGRSDLALGIYAGLVPDMAALAALGVTNIVISKLLGSEVSRR